MGRTRSFFLLIRHAIVCAVLSGAFLIMAVPQVGEALRGTTFGPALPYQTTNSYLSVLCKVSDGSERLQQALDALPPKRPVAVILPDGIEENIFVSYVVSYFAWPREVHFVPVNRANAEHQLQALDRAELAAIFFSGMNPPSGLQPVLRIGAGLVMFPTFSLTEQNAP